MFASRLEDPLDELINQATRQGPAGVVIVGILLILWKGVGPRLAGWTDKIIDHWIDNDRKRNAAHAQLAEALSLHESRDQERHNSMVEHVSDTAKETRHDVRNAMQSMNGMR